MQCTVHLYLCVFFLSSSSSPHSRERWHHNIFSLAVLSIRSSAMLRDIHSCTAAFSNLSLTYSKGYYCSSVTAHYNEFLIWCKANVILRVCEGPHSPTQSTELRFLCFPRQEVNLVVAYRRVNLRSWQPIERGRGGLLNFCGALAYATSRKSHTDNFIEWIY
jgi:hypothetical protein